MIPGNGIIPRYHQSGFIREQNISQKKDKNFNHWKWGPGMEIITVEMFDGVHDEEEDWEDGDDRYQSRQRQLASLNTDRTW